MIIRNDNIQEVNLLNLVGGEGIDTNASAYLSAVISVGGLIDDTSIKAVSTLFTSLKSSNLYNKLIIMYPFVGGVGAAHSINALNPGTNDLFFRNKVSTPWVHTITGSYNTEADSTAAGLGGGDGNWATIGGQYNSYRGTGKTPASIFVSAADMSASFYSRGKLGRGTSGYSSGIFGPAEGGNSRFQIILRDHGSNNCACIFPNAGINPDFEYEFTDTDSTGYYILTRTSESWMAVLKNGSEVLVNDIADTTCELDTEWPLVINTCGGACDTIEYSFLHFGTGLTEAESIDLTNIVQTFQTSLGREV